MTATRETIASRDEAEQRRLNELTDRGHESVADLTHEIGMCRFLVEKASASPALCNALLSTCAKLCVSHQLAMERAGTTLPKETVLRICLAWPSWCRRNSPTCPARRSGSTGPSTRSTPCLPNWPNRKRNRNPNCYASPTKGASNEDRIRSGQQEIPSRRPNHDQGQSTLPRCGPED